MYLPNTYVSALLLIILSMVCWGSWANMQKLAGQWRFELFYYDYSLGVLLTAVLAAYTLGSMNPSELTFVDNLMLTGYRKMTYAVAAGVVFNLANMLLVGAIALSGMAVAFPVGIGLAMVIGVAWNYKLNPQGDPLLLFVGSLMVVAAILVDAMAYGMHSSANATRTSAKAAREKRRRTTKGLIVSLISGVLMGSFYPLVAMSQQEDNGLAPYSVILLFSAGVFLSTLVFNLFFLNLPLDGEPIEMIEYLKGTGKQHLLGLAGGAIWCAGGLANFLAAGAPPKVNVGPAVSYAVGQGATMVSALWGLLVWNEFAGAVRQVKILLAAMIVLFLAGLTVLSIAPLYGK